MNIVVYLPDAIGEKAKAAELPFSHLLRAAVEKELIRREAIANTLQDVKVYEEVIDTKNGVVLGRITGKQIAENDRGDVRAYLTRDGRVLVYDERRQHVYDETHAPAEAFAAWFSDSGPGAHVMAMAAVGEVAPIDL